MFEPWKVQVERAITVEERYGTAKPPIPAGFRGIAFRPAKNGEKWLGPYSHRVVTAYGDYSEDAPVIILAPVLTEIEKKYGEGETPESVWAKHCPCPEKYGKPKFNYPPARVGWVGIDGEFFTPNSTVPLAPRVYAFPLNDWQRLYGEEVPDAAVLEAKLRAEGELKENQFIEPEMKPVVDDILFVSVDTGNPILQSNGYVTDEPRAIVGTRKRGYIRIPYDAVADYLGSPTHPKFPIPAPGSEVTFYGWKGTYVEE